MEVGVFCGFSEATPPEMMAGMARAIEERGFHAIWVPEHVVLFEDYDSRYPYAEDGRIGGYGKGMMEPFTALTFIAAHTGNDWEKGIRAIRAHENVVCEICGSDPTAGMVEMAVRELGSA